MGLSVENSPHNSPFLILGKLSVLFSFLLANDVPASIKGWDRGRRETPVLTSMASNARLWAMVASYPKPTVELFSRLLFMRFWGLSKV